MSPTALFDPRSAGRNMRVAAFMSGSGTNIIKLLEREQTLKERDGVSPFEVIFIFSDRSDGACKGEEIARGKGIPYFSYDIRRFHQMRNLKRTVATSEGLSARKRFDGVARKLVKAFGIDVIALGGYMSYTTLDKCVNVHPADLSILTGGGKRKFVGDQAVRDAIAAGESVIRSSTLWTDEGVDTGPLLMVSKPLKVQLPEPLDDLLRDREKFKRVVDDHQERLKVVGDWEIFPRTVELISRGFFALDKDRKVYMKDRPVPKGYRG